MILLIVYFHLGNTHFKFMLYILALCLLDIILLICNIRNETNQLIDVFKEAFYFIKDRIELLKDRIDCENSYFRIIESKGVKHLVVDDHIIFILCFDTLFLLLCRRMFFRSLRHAFIVLSCY
jgi:hypothetical protein